jgi:hypothetical protein
MHKSLGVVTVATVVFGLTLLASRSARANTIPSQNALVNVASDNPRYGQHYKHSHKFTGNQEPRLAAEIKMKPADIAPEAAGVTAGSSFRNVVVQFGTTATAPTQVPEPASLAFLLPSGATIFGAMGMRFRKMLGFGSR